MWTAATIRRHFSNLAENTIVSRKELLQYGTQDAVDSALGKLLNNKVIVRVACGMYLRPHPSQPLPTAAAIAEARITAFYRTGVRSARDVAQEHGLIGEREDEIVYEVNAATSSFQIHCSGDLGPCVVRLRSRVARKMHLNDTPARRAIKAVWFLREENCTEQIVRRACHHFNRDDRNEFRNSHRFMPGWMSDLVHSMFRTRLVHVGPA
jgi:hypothetical protein